MKIKLNRQLWNKKQGEEIEIGENFGTWAINKGYATEIKDENKAIVTEYENRKVTVTLEGSKLIAALDKIEKRGRKPKK